MLAVLAANKVQDVQVSDNSRVSKQPYTDPALAADLARRLQRANSLLAASYRDLQRQKVVSRLIKDVFGLDDPSASSADLNERFLQTVMEHTMCDMACLFRAGARRGEFSLISGLAPGSQQELPTGLVLLSAPEFFCLPGDSCPREVADEMVTHFGVARMVWIKEQVSGLVLLLVQRLDSTIEWNYDATCREMMEMILTVYSETVSKVKLKSDMRTEKLGAETREVTRGRLITEFLRNVRYSLENIQHNVQVAQAFSSATEVTTQSESLWAILDEAKKTASLARDTEVTFKLDAVNVHVSRASVNLSQILESVLVEVGAEAASRDLEIKLMHADNVRVSVDRIWTEEILKAVLVYIVRSACLQSVIHLSVFRSDGFLYVDLRWRRMPGAGVPSCSGRENERQPSTAADQVAPIMHLVRALGASLTFVDASDLSEVRIERATLKMPEPEVGP